MIPTPVTRPIALKKAETPFWRVPGTILRVRRPLASSEETVGILTWTCHPTCPTMRSTGSVSADSPLLATRSTWVSPGSPWHNLSKSSLTTPIDSVSAASVQTKKVFLVSCMLALRNSRATSTWCSGLSPRVNSRWLAGLTMSGSLRVRSAWSGDCRNHQSGMWTTRASRWSTRGAPPGR